MLRNPKTWKTRFLREFWLYLQNGKVNFYDFMGQNTFNQYLQAGKKISPKTCFILRYVSISTSSCVRQSQNFLSRDPTSQDWLWRWREGTTPGLSMMKFYFPLKTKYINNWETNYIYNSYHDFKYCNDSEKQMVGLLI